jgi:hypothetical protein
MKKLIVLALALLTAAPAFAVITRGGGSFNTSDPERVFVRVKNSEASSTAAAGSLMCGDTTAKDGVSVKLCATTGQPVQCVVPAGLSIAAGKFGTCQIYGLHTALLVSASTNNVTAGGRLVVNQQGAAGKADGKSTGDLLGYSFDAASTSTTVNAFIQLH